MGGSSFPGFEVSGARPRSVSGALQLIPLTRSAGDWIPAPYRVRGRLFAGMTVWGGSSWQ